MTIGDYQLNTMEFGRFRLDGGAMFGVVPKTLWEKVAPADERNRVRLALRCLLIRGGGKVILVDAGLGDKDPESFRRIFAVENDPQDIDRCLAAHGLGRGEVTDLILSHLHFDHGGGAVRRGESGDLEPAFPNAVHHIQRRQWEWAFDPSPRDRASYLKQNLEPLRSTRLNLVEGEAEPLPGIELLPVDGHSPGMQLVHVFSAGSGGETGAVYCADLVPTAAHLPLPWVMAYDLDPLRSIEEKRKLYDRFADARTWLIFEHDPRLAAVRIRMGAKQPEVLESREAL